MKVIYHILIFFTLTFSLFIGTGFLILAVNGEKNRMGGDSVYYAISDGFTFLLVMLCVVSSIIFIFLYKILKQLKINNNR